MYRALICILLFTFSAKGQDNTIESGKRLLLESKYDSALITFRNGLIQCNNACDDSTFAYLLLWQGRTYQMIQRYDSALVFFDHGLNLFQKNNHLNGVMQAQIFIGEFYRHISDYQSALESFKKAEKFLSFEEISDENRAWYFNRYAALLAETEGKEEDIIYCLNKSAEIAKQNGLKQIEAASLNQLGYFYDSRNRDYPRQEDEYFPNQNDELAILYFNSALEIYTELNDARSIVDVSVNIARYYHNIRQYQKSIEVCQEGLDVIGENDWVLSKRELYFYMSRDYDFLGEFQKAFESHEIYHQYELQLKVSLLNESLKEVETKFEVEKKDDQINLARQENRIIKLESDHRKKQLNYVILILVLVSIITMILVISWTKIKNTNKLLSSSIGEKEILLQEVHHRIKNNLTLLKSLLYLRGNAADNDEVKMVLAECQSRVQSMAIVHENLYDVEDASHVDYHVFLEQLIKESQDLFGSEGLQLTTRIETNGITLEMGTAIFLGLILNELLTNSFKYSFEKRGEHFVNIQMLQTGDILAVEYQDSGRGLPDNYQNLSAKDGFGFRLINILLKQIEASIEYHPEKNTFVIQLEMN